jgi:hypothetical protein
VERDELYRERKGLETRENPAPRNVPDEREELWAVHAARTSTREAGHLCQDGLLTLGDGTPLPSLSNDKK